MGLELEKWDRTKEIRSSSGKTRRTKIIKSNQGLPKEPNKLFKQLASLHYHYLRN
jgi:hypothetical protein